MANKRIKDLTERTTLAAGDYLATDNDNGTRKVNASKILTAISTAQSTADNVATKVSNSGDAFSSSKGYSVGELCIYNNKVYRCKTAYSTGASWSSRSSNFEQVTLTDAITDLNNDLNKNYTLSDAAVSIASYTSISNCFTCPSDGYLRGSLTNSSNVALQVACVSNTGTSTGVNNQFFYMAAGRLDVKEVFVKKGMKLYVVSRPTTGAEAPTFRPLVSY